MSASLDQLLAEACESVRHQIGVGQVANYIPVLADVDAHQFGAAIITVDGERASYGQAQQPFSIQSISKVFTLALALKQQDEQIFTRVGREPSGNAFNSIVQLEQEAGVPRNPFINAGALVISDILLDQQTPADAVQHILHWVRQLAIDVSIEIDAQVASSELATGHRNLSLLHFMRSFNNIKHATEAIMQVYCNQCALSMSCEQLARAFLFLANEGEDPLTKTHIVNAQCARRINSIMMLCGHYDASGDFAFRVGLPGKSGVGGGIVVVVPDRAAIAVWSPALNPQGNSHAGTAALQAIVEHTGWNMF